MTTDAHRIGLAFDRFRSWHDVPCLVIMDCETRRFTIERPSSQAVFQLWWQEIEHIVASGRHLVCVPVDRNNVAAIEAIGAGLGYVLWPPRTIVSPPEPAPGESSPRPGKDSKTSRQNEEQRRRLLARVGLP
jgi:hypothetical protein